MIPTKIGNWLINKDGIKWDGEEKIEYNIAKHTIIDERDDMYEWLIHMVEKSWLSREDIYALNTAFIYAMEKFKIPFPKNLSFVETFDEQENELKQRESYN